tara:strand:- start:50 stop:1078 length:1029 start_codon:yes stop_codon:yes gene_type:complete
MKFLIIIISILIFLFKSQNTFSDSSIFVVNNIQIENKDFKTKQQLVNISIKKAFKELSDRILLRKDRKKLGKISINETKNLVSHYQIKKEEDFETIVNIYFDRKKIHNFLYKNNIQYSDLDNEEILIFPLLVEKRKLFLFEGNYLYQNWNKPLDNKKELIEFILPVENIEIIRKLSLKTEELESININEIMFDYEIKNKVFLVAELNESKINLFFRLSIDDKNLVKNFELDKNANINILDKIISFSKDEIIEIYKTENMIDLAAPSFLNLNLDIASKDDLFKFENFLKEIDIIDSFNVQSLSNKNALIRIKYFGKVEKIFKKISNGGINIKNINNEWVIKIN